MSDVRQQKPIIVEGRLAEELLKLNRSRAGHAATVTRRVGLLRQVLRDGCTEDVVNDKYEQLQTAIQNFKEAFNMYSDLAVNVDPAKLPLARDHYVDLEKLWLTAEEEMDAFRSQKLKPSDSVSQAGSGVSSTSSARAKAAAKRAALEARLQHSNQQNQLEFQQMELQWKRREAELQAELSATMAEEEVLARFEEQNLHEPIKPNHQSTPAPVQKTQILDPKAPVWSPNPTPITQYNTVPVRSTMSADTTLQQQMLDSMNLPKCTLMTFDGDPMEFWTFMSSFDMCVGNTLVDDGAKLNRLFEYCKGKASQIIKPCALMSPTAGYQRARELLKRRFGNEFQIAEAWVRKVTEGPMIKPNDSDALQDLADDMLGCIETLRAMNMLHEIDSRMRMVKILSRLPIYLQARWRKNAVDKLERHGTYPSIEDLSEFLERAARECNDPVFGSLNYPVSKGQDGKKPTGRNFRGKGASFGLQADSSNIGAAASPSMIKVDLSSTKPKLGQPDARRVKCFSCEGEHHLYSCPSFIALTPKERFKFVRSKGICFNCLNGKNHRAGVCHKPSQCSCGRKHTKLLHEAFESSAKGSENDASYSKESAVNEASSCAASTQGPKVALPIVPVIVRGRGQEIRTHALLDPGSNRSFCSQGLIKRLGLEGSSSRLSLETLNCGQNIDVKEVSVSVSPVTGKQRPILLSRVCGLEQFPSFHRSSPSHVDFQKWKHFLRVDIPNLDEDVCLLIGQDVPEALVPLEVRCSGPGQPYAIRTKLGWSLNGPLASECSETEVVSNFVQADREPNTALEMKVEQFWNIDSGHLLDDDNLKLSVADNQVLEVWGKSVKKVEGHYQLDIPFKNESPELPDSRPMAEARLKNLAKRLSRNPDLHKKYTENMDELIQNGYAEHVPPEEIGCNPGKTWYLPHHNVVNKRKPEKFRIVFDCAAEYYGTSLNKNIHQGPDMTNKLLGVFLRFRELPVAIMGDIKCMFHQVNVTPEDRDVLRFLWWQNGKLDESPEVYRMTVHLFGGVWSPSCASYALHRTGEDHKEEFSADIVEILQRDFYVDDCLSSLDNPDQAKQAVLDLSDLLSRGGFLLRKWISNSREVIAAIPSELRSSEAQSLDLSSSVLPIERALGTVWDTENDVLRIHIQPVQSLFTRRGLLSTMSSIYDPLGLVCPFVVVAKIIFQNECRLKTGWDEQMSPEGVAQWTVWLNDLPKLDAFVVDRCLIPKDFGEIATIELHNFADASQLAYGAVSYVRVQSVSGRVHCAFVMAKARLAPIKQITVPRLELIAAVVAVRLSKTVQRELRTQFDRVYYWTDSMIVLSYIRNQTSRFRTFVANRLSIIHGATSVDDWRYVDTKSNPADDASRGMSMDMLLSQSRWINGPVFLCKEEKEWPTSEKGASVVGEHDLEMKCEIKSCAALSVREGSCLDKFFQYFSSWFRLCKALAWILKFVKWLRSPKESRKNLKQSLSVPEIADAERLIIRTVQQTYFQEEIKVLEKQGSVPKRSEIYSLEPFIDSHGLLRIGGRLQAAPVGHDVKHPVIIHKGHLVAELLVRHHHAMYGHVGREHVVSLVREKYWIPKMRKLVERIIKQCVICKRFKGRPVGQRMASLPEDRVSPGELPFAVSGLDCFGPFYVKRGRSQEKRYGCIFTCLTTRAVHIEKLSSMESDSFINSLVRFMSRRGAPKKLRSDNGTNFTGAERELNREFERVQKDPALVTWLLKRKVVWEFNPPGASHQGGVWERQIRSVRRIMNCVIGNQVLDDERLDTLFCEVESVLNSRPLTCVSKDSNDEEVLTPNHLLLLRSGPDALTLDGRKQDMYGRRWRHVQFLADRFWQRWVREYLPTLHFRSKWMDEVKNLKEGDMVLIMEENLPRKVWPLGRVIRTFPGKDGLVRAAELKTSHGQLVRPVTKLCHLEGVNQCE